MGAYKTYCNQQENFDYFLERYGQLLFYLPPEAIPQNRIPKRQRTCRFCNKTGLQVKFKTNPHIIPELLGSNGGVSDFECDECNKLFSLYENHLADYLGLIRTFYGVNSKKNIPQFKAPRESLVAKPEKLAKDKTGVFIYDLNRKGFDINPETGINTITYTKNTYIPINVYKAVLKIALSLIPHQYVPRYRIAFDFILSGTNHPDTAQYAKIFITENAYKTDEPYCYLFERKPDAKGLASHIFKLYFHNFIYQIFLPAYALDIAQGLYSTGHMSLTFCPPILSLDEDENLYHYSEMKDFSSTVKVKDEVDKLIFNGGIKFSDQGQMIDAKTGEKYPFKPENIVKIGVIKINDGEDADDYFK